MTNPSETFLGVRPYRTIVLAVSLLVVLPFALSLVNLTFAEHWKIHFFQAAVFLAAIRFGPAGGLCAGVAGSLYTAVMLGNPYLIVGNMILGGMTGVVYHKTDKLMLSVLAAYACQLPWLLVSSYFFAGLSALFIGRLVVVLLLGNVLWAALINLCRKPVRKYLW